MYNEDADLERSVRRLLDFVRTGFPFTFRITIADNASTDRTWAIASALAAEYPEHVRAVHLDEKGRGRALRTVWTRSDASVLCYMDVDLSTDLNALLPLVAPLVSGHSDVAIGTRLSRSSRVVRGAKREVISRVYNLLLRTTLAARFSDAQCGFKAIRADVARQLLPNVQDTGWFFDTELLVLAERSGRRIHEVPVDWVDDPDSRVDILATALGDLKGVVRLVHDFTTGRISLPVADDRGYGVGMSRQLLRFGVIGAISTLAYVVIYLLLRETMAATSANALALFITAVANTAANRAYTFGVRGAPRRLRHQMQGLFVFAIGLALSTGALWLLHMLAPDSSRVVELGAVVAANLGATLVRFLMFRSWVFRPGHSMTSVSHAVPAKENS